MSCPEPSARVRNISEENAPSKKARSARDKDQQANSQHKGEIATWLAHIDSLDPSMQLQPLFCEVRACQDEHGLHLPVWVVANSFPGAPEGKSCGGAFANCANQIMLALD